MGVLNLRQYRGEDGNIPLACGKHRDCGPCIVLRGQLHSHFPVALQLGTAFQIADLSTLQLFLFDRDGKSLLRIRGAGGMKSMHTFRKTISPEICIRVITLRAQVTQKGFCTFPVELAFNIYCDKASSPSLGSCVFAQLCAFHLKIACRARFAPASNIN